jgi:hypothetical protein
MAPNRWHDGAKSHGITDHRVEVIRINFNLTPPPASHNSPAAAVFLCIFGTHLVASLATRDFKYDGATARTCPFSENLANTRSVSFV